MKCNFIFQNKTNQKDVVRKLALLYMFANFFTSWPNGSQLLLCAICCDMLSGLEYMKKTWPLDTNNMSLENRAAAFQTTVDVLRHQSKIQHVIITD